MYIIACGTIYTDLATAQNEPTLSGTVTHIRGGDTIKVASISVRLEGVSAPEMRERLGRDSKKFMSDLVSGPLLLSR